MKPGDILDEDGTRYRVGSNGERIAEWSEGDNRSRKMPLGWLFIGSLTTLLLLAIGAFLRRRQQSGIR